MQLGRFTIESLEYRRLFATLPAGFTEQTITTFTDQPTSQIFAPDGRLFVTLEGTNDTSGPADVRVIKNGVVLPTPLLTVTTQSFFERGLLGIALGPNFSSAADSDVYVYYTLPSSATPTITHRVERWTVPAGSDVANPASRTTIFDIAVPVGQSSPGNHNGGAMGFGPDGKLYIAVGDNAAVPGNAQNATNLFGKMLRINPDGSIPADNPFLGITSGVNRAIWAFGLRNPYTFAFQPGTGRLFINDVGSSGSGRREEINDGIAGSNYGWPGIEGFRAAQPLPSIGTYRDPLHAHNDGFAITGGTFYNPSTPMFPANYIGRYFYGDYVGGFFRTVNPSAAPPLTATAFGTGASGPLDFDVSPVDGALWYIEYSSRNVKRIFVNTSLLPLINDQPQNRTVSLEEPAQFSVAAGGTGLSYQWQRNNVNIPGATSATYVLQEPSLADSGAVFRAIVTNANGSVPSNGATLTVLNNYRPEPAITTPVPGTLFQIGVPISFSGSATDREDGELPVTALHWEVSYRTGQVDRNPILVLDDVAGGSFIPEVVASYTDPTVTYFIDLTATDSAGTVRTFRRELQPVTADVTLASNVPGLTVLLDSQQRTTPFTFTGIAGFERPIEAPLNQVLNGQTYVFQNWSDGGAAAHVIATPTANATFTATYNDITNPLVNSGAFAFDDLAPLPPHRAQLVFSENVSASLAASDVTITRRDDNSVIPTGSIALSYDTGTNTASFSFPGLPGGVLPDGNYRISIPAGSVTDSFGNALAGAFQHDFFVFQGDANHDRIVNISDFSALAANFNETGTRFSEGDFDYNGTTNINDFSVLAARFNQTLPDVLQRNAGERVSSGSPIKRNIFADSPIVPAWKSMEESVGDNVL